MHAAEIFFTRLIDAEEELVKLMECMYDRDVMRFKGDVGFLLSFRSKTPTGTAVMGI